MFRRFSRFSDENWRALFLNDFLFTIVNFHVKRQLLRISWRRSQTTKFARVFDRCVALFISERFDVSIKIAHDTIISTINRKNFCISFTQMSISRIVIENCNVSACFIVFFKFVQINEFSCFACDSRKIWFRIAMNFCRNKNVIRRLIEIKMCYVMFKFFR
jgi:hypothetical protein